MIIYKVTNKTNGKIYIGQTVKSMEKRKYNHLCRSLHNGDNNYFHSALKKYGSKNFDWKVIDRCDTIKESNKLEIYYICKFDAFDNGYNLTTGGNNCTMSEKTKRKISKSQMGKKNHNYGKKHSEETIRKMSEVKRGKNNSFYGKKHSKTTRKRLFEVNKGKEVSEETRKKLSKINSGRNNPFYGKRHSAKSREKMSNFGKPVTIKGFYFYTIVAAAEFFDTTARIISYRIKKGIIGYRHVHTGILS